MLNKIKREATKSLVFFFKYISFKLRFQYGQCQDDYMGVTLFSISSIIFQIYLKSKSIIFLRSKSSILPLNAAQDKAVQPSSSGRFIFIPFAISVLTISSLSKFSHFMFLKLVSQHLNETLNELHTFFDRNM